MPVVKSSCIVLLSALILLGCRDEPPACPVGTVTVDPSEIPEGTNLTSVSVDVENPFPSNGLSVVTELSTPAGAIEDPFARETTYACPFDFSGETEICVTTTYEDPDAEEQANGTASTGPKLRGPNVYLPDPIECTTVRCTPVVCPTEKNACPDVSSLTIAPEVLEEGQTATITVVAEDPDDNPEALETMLSARHGVIADPTARTTTYACDPNVGGVVQICVVASDGDSSCDVERCSMVRCPGDPLENTCPIIESFTADPVEEAMTTVRVDATDPDDFPVALRTELSADTGVFEDRFASETTFTCGASGPVELCVRANDGDPGCFEYSCITVQCPNEIPENLCPMLFVINGVPRVIPDGDDSTLVQTRAQDTDGLPVPMTLTLSALWGSFENTDNIEKPLNVVEQNATYVCDRPGVVEICVDATDGACTKTLCDTLVCPDSVESP